jgi:predicted DsbA family dithiol-disulfide isomerase
MSKPQVDVQIWSDVMCPWCAVGWTSFAKAIEKLEGEGIAVEARFMPFELNPDLAPEGKEQARHLAEVYGRSPEEVAAMRAQMQARADQAGFAMQWTGEGEEPSAWMWNTFEAHKLLRWALAAHGPEAQQRLKVALLEAHFQQRRNVGDREVLLDIAEAEGFNRTETSAAMAEDALAIATRMEEQRGREMGINSVPSFVVEGKYVIQGARDAADYAQMLRQVAGATATA